MTDHTPADKNFSDKLSGIFVFDLQSGAAESDLSAAAAELSVQRVAETCAQSLEERTLYRLPSLMKSKGAEHAGFQGGSMKYRVISTGDLATPSASTTSRGTVGPLRTI